MQTALEQCFSFQFCHHRQAPSHRRPNLSPTPPHLPASQRLLCLQCRKRQALNWQRRLQANAAEGAKAAQRLHVGGMVLTVERGMPPPRPYPWAQLLLSTVRPATAAPSMDHVKQPAAHLLVKHVGCERLQIQQVEPRAILRSSMGR